MIDDFKIYQDDSLYTFTSDAVLLSRFATVKKGDEVADFCSGSGIVGLNLFALNQDKVNSVTLFELQKPLYELSCKSIKINKLENKFNAVNTAVQDIGKEYNGKFSLIVCNPPYMEVGGGDMQEREEIALCFREIKLPLDELLKSVNKALKFGGRFCMVYRADRLVTALYKMREYKIEPKRLQFVSAKNKEPYLFMVEGVKGGKPSIKILKGTEN